jgi:hypothetical protein
VSRAWYSTPGACFPCTSFLPHLSCHLLLEPLPAQKVNDLPPEDERPSHQPVRGLPAGESEDKSIFPRRQLADLQVVQVVLEKIFSPRDGSIPSGPDVDLRSGQPHAPPSQRPRPATTRLRETPVPEIHHNALRCWAADAVPGLSLDRERDKFLCYARARGLTNMDWSEALKFWWLEAHARAVRRGELQLSAAPRPEPRPEAPPLYDAKLHAQMQADIARLCGTIGQSTVGANDHQGPCQSHALSIPATEGMALEHDLEYLAQIQARKAMLLAQAALLQAQAADLEVTGAAD